MNTKKAITITAIAIALTGLITGAIFLAKKTGQKPKVQTNAYYNLTQYNYTNDTYTINGRPEIYNTENKNLLPKINYTIRKNQNDTYYIKLMTNGLIYRQDDDFYNINVINYQTSIINETTTQAYQDKLSDIVIIWTNTEIAWQAETTKLKHYYQVQLLLMNENGIIHREYINFETTQYTLNYTPFTNDPEGYPYTYETLPIYNAILELQDTYQTGYTTGYQTKGDLADGNFVSIQETMLNVLTMPFTFISQAFNVTMWEGTPYAINLSNFIKSLIAIATILFIIKMFTTGFSVIGNYTTSKSSTRLDRQQKRATIEKTKAETRRTNKLADKGK